ncbi:uncharacterized protein cubi_01832 [Cryptosporidium ubiquitum]|uniref:Uncharacterized protein n=1 Tax=Cryptosporidium ubiquitum TaxID=857276 RepID=A0A1J4MMN9_9CRYT|nr:uncharacterized protein cubi_01832 [Cryptosporidium ubiquitum]OII75311.1 hypothetical protein cubi_01832 [Cryptosporidium ubiquitum]
MEFSRFVLFCYILGIKQALGVNDLSSFIDSSSTIDNSIFNEYEQSKNEYQKSVLSSEVNNNLGRGFPSSTRDNSNESELKDGFVEFSSISSSYHPNSEFSENLRLFSNLLISPIMDKSTAILGELSFKYSLDGIRSELINAENYYSPTKLFNKLFGPRGEKNNTRLLRYGFLHALINEINNHFLKEIDFKYKLHRELLTDTLKYEECIGLFNDANKQNKALLTMINKRIFEIICDQVANNNSFIKMQSWDNHISKIINHIQKSIHSISENFNVKPKAMKINDFPEVPEIKVSGTDIKLRYLNIVKSIDAIKKKEHVLFNSLIFTKKMAVRISTQYLQNGNELVQRCIEIIKFENPALMREKYQREKLEQICKISMGS